MERRGHDRRNTLMLTGLLGLAFAMVGLSFAAVPLYDLFCRVTGYGGTTQVSDAAPGRVLDREIRVRFSGTADSGLPRDFAPEQREITLRVGEAGLAFYSARNLSDRPITGMAAYNVTPAKAGLYFHKIQCFCFDEQVLAPGESVSMPVYFFVDPAIADDPNLDDIKAVTLSYTFYRSAADPVEELSLDIDNADDRAALAGARSTTIAAASGR